MTPDTKTISKAELSLALGRTMAELRNQIRQFLQSRLKSLDINITFEMLEVMYLLLKRDGINQQELADLTFRDKASMTYLLDNLEKRQLVKRAEDGNDRRSKLIFLTDEGKELQKKLNPSVTEVYEKAAGGLSPDDLNAGISLLNSMTGNLRATEDLR